MNITGVLTEAKPMGNPMGRNSTRYAFGKLRIADGREIDLMFVNRDFVQLANRPITISDISEKQDKVRWEADKNRYRIMGTGVSIECEGQEYAGQPVQRQPAQPQSNGYSPPASNGSPPGVSGAQPAASQPLACMEDLVDFGLNAVNYARQKGESDSVILGSIFGSSMHGYKEGRQINPETWSTRVTFNATSVPAPADPAAVVPHPPQAAPHEQPPGAPPFVDDDDEPYPF